MHRLESGLQPGLDDAFVINSEAGHTTFGGWLDACVRETGSDARLVWAPDEVLLEHEVAIWSGLPLWAPVRDDAAGAWQSDVSRAVAAGLVCRPISDTVRDTWAWFKDEPSPADEFGRIAGQGLPPADERRILAALTD
jgi:2'-hydroxyisoflavone reductase